MFQNNKGCVVHALGYTAITKSFIYNTYVCEYLHHRGFGCGEAHDASHLQNSAGPCTSAWRRSVPNVYFVNVRFES